MSQSLPLTEKPLSEQMAASPDIDAPPMPQKKILFLPQRKPKLSDIKNPAKKTE